MWHEWQTGELCSVLAGRHEVKRQLEALVVDSTMLKLIFKKCKGGGMDWICLAKDRDS